MPFHDEAGAPEGKGNATVVGVAGFRVGARVGVVDGTSVSDGFGVGLAVGVQDAVNVLVCVALGVIVGLGRMVGVDELVRVGSDVPEPQAINVTMRQSILTNFNSDCMNSMAPMLHRKSDYAEAAGRKTRDRNPT